MVRKTAVLHVFLASAFVTIAAGPDMQKLVNDTQRLRQEDKQIDLVWWIPSQYWEISFKENPALTSAQKDEFIRIVDDYIVFAVLEGTIGVVGGISGTPRAQLIDKLSVTINNQTLKPLADSELSNEARTFFRIMKPILTNMMGQIGQGMEFITFRGKDADGKNYAAPDDDGLLTVKLGEKSFNWRLPLGCFLPPKYDADTGEEFPGNYRYSPFTGAKLVDADPQWEAACKLWSIEDMRLGFEDNQEGFVKRLLTKNPELTPFSETIMKWFREHLGDIYGAYIKLYSQNFTTDELVKLAKLRDDDSGAKDASILWQRYCDFQKSADYRDQLDIATDGIREKYGNELKAIISEELKLIDPSELESIKKKIAERKSHPGPE